MLAHLAEYALVELRLAQHRWDDAATQALALGEGLRHRGAVDHPSLQWRPARAPLAARARGDRDAARDLIAEQWQHAALRRRLDMTGTTLSRQALVEGGERGIELLHESARVLAATPARLEHARTLVDLGATLRRAKRRAEARETLRAALDVAAPLWRRPARRARPRGDRRNRSQAAARPPHGRRRPDAQRAARRPLAAEGLTNLEIAQALFVTRKTIESQLGAVYRKLDVNDRERLGTLLPPPPEKIGSPPPMRSPLGPGKLPSHAPGAQPPR